MARQLLNNSMMQGLQFNLEGVDLSLNSLVSLLRRRWPVLAATTIIIVSLTALVLSMVPREYTAHTLLQVNNKPDTAVNFGMMMSTMGDTDAKMRTEVDILQSRRLAKRVVDKLELTRDPDFLSQGVNPLKGMASGIKLYVKTLLAKGDEKKLEASDAEVSSAISSLLNNLQVGMQPRSYTIRLSYTTSTPELAAKVLNEISNQYLTNSLEDRFEANQRANEWVNDRIQELQKNVQAAELAVETHRQANGLQQARGVTITEQQLSELNSQLILARTYLAEANAKYASSRQLSGSGGRGIATASEVINNPLIQNLRQQETEVRRTMSDLASRYGERHPRMVTIRNELRDVQRKIAEESQNIKGSLGNEVGVAQARVATLQNQLNALEQKSNLSGSAEVRMMELERQAQASRTLYESFLTRSKEISQMDFQESNAKIISAAEVPLGPSFPNSKLSLVMAALIGLLLGTGLMLLLEMLDSGFRTAVQLEQTLGMPVLGMLSELSGEADIARYTVEKPSSAFTESVRAIRTAVQFSRPDHNVQVWCVTSSVPEEGKSTLALALAQTLAMGGQNKVLLLDADLRRPRVAKQLGIETDITLSDVLIGKADYKKAIVSDKISNIDIMGASPDTKFAQELLSSQKMADLMAKLRKDYDAIVLDTPPVMAVADVVTLSPLVDSIIYAVRWGTTPRNLAMNALKQLENCSVKVNGVVFSRVDLNRQQAYGAADYGYYYGKYKGYYQD